MTPTDDLFADEVPEHGPWDHLAIALDVDDVVVALRLATELQPWFRVAKVGLELFSSAGPEVIGSLHDLGYDVFCDLKLHDIPTTVGKAARVIGSLGASYLTVHTAGGVDMVRAGNEGLLEGAANAGLTAPSLLGVTVLTSDPDASQLRPRLDVALEAGCEGVVCAATDLAEVLEVGPELVTVVPGIRPEGTSTDDQARVATPRAAIEAGADLLVIGRVVTAADDPAAAAAAIVESLS
ncbi:orotidine-5'-phosphate decarboxylase [Actinomarinicola tropica]|uniref:Orotidine 5'-phosphate decarboxylase n=1 Tax=Actinomarinicola tropica TaxID=2789776 RepID=A0A5Q2RKS2_9ACTN|nr:orotidine-5'-phosphate decarboxylase [Actinomarinicola tropica]QGG95181.1 orotidine-5'-phosphate decarboxylase [Actinomarinicola tropica]